MDLRSARREVMADTLFRLMSAQRAELAHLNTVLRKKNRKIAWQRQEMLTQKDRIVRLLKAFDAVLKVSTRAEAQGIAARVLAYDERQYWNSRRREVMTMDEQNAASAEPTEPPTSPDATGDSTSETPSSAPAPEEKDGSDD